MRSNRKKNWALTIFILILLSTIPSRSFAQEELPRVSVGYSGLGAAFLPVWIAKEKNLYRRYGLNVDLIYIGGGSKLMQALIAGDVQFVSLGAGIIEASIRGAETVYLAAWNNNFIFSIYGAPDIKTPLDLKGAKVGVTRFGTATETATVEALKKYGLDARKDVTLIQTGGTPETLAALSAGTIRAGTISPPNTFLAEKLGFVEVINIPKLKIPFITTGLASTKRYIVSHREITMNLVKAVVESIQIIKSESAFTKGVISKYTRLKDNELINKTYSFFVKELTMPPYPSVDALKFMVGLISKTEKDPIQIPIESFVDTSFLRSLQQEGFFKAPVQR